MKQPEYQLPLTKTVVNNGLSKQDYLDLIRLLSALESWGMTTAAMHKTPFPDYLLEDLGNCLEKLEKEVLK